jgi:putative flippase GtrA
MKSYPQLRPQLLRYAMIGIASNAFGYNIYLFITWLGLGSVQAMSFVYGSICFASFFGNKRWTFSDSTRARKTILRYVVIQIVGYLTNLLMLLVLYKQFGVPHQWVQLIAIAVVATELFLLSKYYVFCGAKRSASP